MRYFLFLYCMCVGLFSGYPVYAQDMSAQALESMDQQTEPYLVDQQICFKVRNTAPYGVYGDVATARMPRPEDGQEVTHTATFRLKEGEETPMCTTGPFFPGQKLRITLRTLVPIFECKTTIIPNGTILIRGQRGESDYEGTKTWVECL